MARKLPDLKTLGDDDLQKLDEDMAAERTELREAQVAVSNERAFRQALRSLSPSQQEALQVRVGGAMGVRSESKSEKAQ